MRLTKLLAILICTYLFIGINQAQAASFNLTAKEDGYYKQYNDLVVSSVNFTNSSFLYTKIKSEPNPNVKSYKLNTILKFDFNDNASLMTALQNESVISVTLHMYQWRYEGSNNQLPNSKVFQVGNNWSETQDYILTPEFDTNNTVGQMWTSGNSSNAHQWVTSQLEVDAIAENDNNIYSIVISDMNENFQNQYFTESAFKAKEYCNGRYAPYITIETAPTPAPEPTSMLLGLMGIAGASRLRRKNK